VGERAPALAHLAVGPLARQGAGLTRVLIRSVRRWGAPLERRVRRRLEVSLHDAIGDTATLPELARLGLDADRLEELCAAHGAAALANQIGQRGATAAHLQRIAWHGSALADLGCPPDSPERIAILEDCALFNLAVALTDSVVDDHGPAARQTALLLSPDRLRRRLAAPQDAAATLADPGNALATLFALWDSLLVRIGTRVSGQGGTVAEHASMLEQMHRSEFGAHANRIPAKTLPIEFIGLLVCDGAGGGAPGSSSRRSQALLYRELGLLIGLVDDWGDLPGDIRHMRANQFILTRGLRRGHRLVYVARCMYRLGRPGRLCDHAVNRIAGLQRRVLAAAADVSTEARARTASYLLGLQG
jgi:hypothetical protein